MHWWIAAWHIKKMWLFAKQEKNWYNVVKRTEQLIALSSVAKSAQDNIWKFEA